MVDLGAIAGLMSALNGAVDITKAMVDLRDAAAFQSKVIDLQRNILEAQQSAFAAQGERVTLIKRISTLEEDVAHLKAWDAEKQHYELKPMRQGQYSPLAYTLKDAVAGAEPIHWLCTNCYEKGEKSILQPESAGMSVYYVCHRCSLELNVIGSARDRNRRR